MNVLLTCPQKTGNAIRAVGRMATLSASRRNSGGSNSKPGGQRISTADHTMCKMSSLNEEHSCDTELPDSLQNNKLDNSECASKLVANSVVITNKILHTATESKEDNQKSVLCENNNQKQLYRTRSCSERSDSGISDCSNHALTSGSCSCTSTPLLSKRFSINEEPEEKKLPVDSKKITQRASNSIITAQDTHKHTPLLCGRIAGNKCFKSLDSSDSVTDHAELSDEISKTDKATMQSSTCVVQKGFCSKGKILNTSV